MNLLRVSRSDRPSRFYVDGRRVSRDGYYNRVDEAARAGRLQNSFISRTSIDRHGAAIRREHSSI
jgi:hypothetical protein